MELIINKLRIPVEKDGIDEYLRTSSERLKTAVENIKFSRILSKSLDMGDKTQFFYEISIVVNVHDSFENKENFQFFSGKTRTAVTSVKIKGRPIIVGFGPAGMFAALELLDYGIKPLIFERG
ncbi:MAG: dehydrogenase, partial [Lentisphaerota bacterium]